MSSHSKRGRSKSRGSSSRPPSSSSRFSPSSRPSVFSASKRPSRADKLQARELEAVEIKECERRIIVEAPSKGSHPLAADLLNKKYSPSSSSTTTSAPLSIEYTAVRNFDELPISARSKRALRSAGFTRMTDVQRATIPHALIGRDLLAAARTGSGKTISFLLPLIECLWRLKWDAKRDGVGALIISPTRELAVQIFEVLRQIGGEHELSAGLIIGGKSLSEEQERIHSMAILVCTPGRLLQHFDQTFGFDVSNLSVLVLDEADRILDLGFSSTLDSILDHLPQKRQTLLFSATQTKSVRDLARLSLSSPEYLAVHANDDVATPDKLAQHFMVAPCSSKLDLAFSFVKTHLKSKSLLFLSACKQVRFVYEMFRRLRPGVPLLHLHGNMSQQRRMGVYYDFCARSEVAMFCTDIAARGLDFPDVDWVVQIDAPDTAATYIHRVGRTARYRAGGSALLMLDPSEEPLVAAIEKERIRLEQIKVNPAQVRSVRATLQAAMIENAELKLLGQKALLAYLKAIHLRSDKIVFDVSKIDVVALAESMGLPAPPAMRLGAGKATADKDKNIPYALKDLLDGKVKKKKEDDRGMKDLDKLLRRKRPAAAPSGRTAASEDEDDILVPRKSGQRRKEEESEDEDNFDDLEPLPDLSVSSLLRDDEEKERNEEKESEENEEQSKLRIERDMNGSMEATRDWLSNAGTQLRDQDVDDKAREYERIHAKHQKRRRQERAVNLSLRPNASGDGDDDDGAPRLAMHEEDNAEVQEENEENEEEQDMPEGDESQEQATEEEVEVYLDQPLDVDLLESEEEELPPVRASNKPSKRVRETNEQLKPHRKKARIIS